MYIFQHMSYVPKPYFWSRIGSPWLGLGSNSARMDPAAYRNLFKPLPALREPIFGPKISKYLSVRHDPSRRPVRVRRDPAASPRVRSARGADTLIRRYVFRVLLFENGLAATTPQVRKKRTYGRSYPQIRSNSFLPGLLRAMVVLRLVRPMNTPEQAEQLSDDGRGKPSILLNIHRVDA